MLATQSQLCILPCPFSYSYLPCYCYCYCIIYYIIDTLIYYYILLSCWSRIMPVSLNWESCSLSVCATCCLNFAFFCSFSVPPTLNYGFRIAVRLDSLLPSMSVVGIIKHRLLQNTMLKIVPGGKASEALNLQPSSPAQKFHLSLAVPGSKMFSSS